MHADGQYVTTMRFWESRGAHPATRSRKPIASRRKELHPDRNSDNPEAEAQFKEANEAYDVLKDPDKKAAYDRFGHAAFDGWHGRRRARPAGFGGPQGQGDFASAFSTCSRISSATSWAASAVVGAAGQSRGADLRYKLGISLEKCLFGSAETDQRADRGCPAGPAAERGRKGGSEPVTCPTCFSHGQACRAQQGFFTVERICPTCSVRRPDRQEPCKACGGRARGARCRRTAR